MRYQFFVVSFIMCFSLLLADHCSRLLHTLATDQMIFVQCSTMNSVPVNVCVNCQKNHSSMLDSYNILLTSPNCSEQYFDKDRINLISTMQSILTELWDKAYCDDCFASDNVDTFTLKSNALTFCFEKNKNKECEACVADYQDLNSFYNSLDVHNKGQVCYDIQDLMNRTRSIWSKDFKCCKRHFNMTLFLLASISAIILPLIFYFSAFMYGRRRERNHGVLDADPEITAPLVDANVSGSEESHHDMPSTTIHSPEKTLRCDTESDESEYEDTGKNI